MKTWTRIRSIALLASAYLSMASMTPAYLAQRPVAVPAAMPQAATPGRLSSAEAERIIADRARGVLRALKEKNMGKLATFVHPTKGVRFSPYAHVLPEEDRVFRKNQIARLWSGTKRSLWGSYDGTGDPIRLTFRNYYRRFIYDHDYLRAKRIGYNADIIGRGTLPNNIAEIYPGSIVAEYHFPGFDPEFDGMDWRSLWLVFQKKDAVWYLVGIVHGQWTT